MTMYLASLLAGAIMAAVFVVAMNYSTVAQPPARPARQVDDSYPPTLRDIARHLPYDDLLKARHDSDVITWAHEAHHFLNSRLSDARKRGFYVLDNTVYRFPIPKSTKLRDVAEAIPEELRGKVYHTYLIAAQRDWNDIPLYMYDEALAYWTGAMVRQEIGRKERQETERFGVELLVYSLYATNEMCLREGEDFPKQDVQDFLDLMVARARVICPEFDEQPHAKALANIGRSLEVADAKEER
jgi:hypothetical protein